MRKSAESMMKMKCEEFERQYGELVAGALNVDRRAALERHRESCKYCARFTTESETIRKALLNLSKLEASPYLAAGIRREINRLERGISHPDWSPRLLPRFVALGTGFALAIICSLIIFESGGQRADNPLIYGTNGANNVVAERENTGIAPTVSDQDQPAENPAALFTSTDSNLDTMTHRLPEPAGTDSIPVPTEDDLWRLNQVSTTPGDN